MSVEPAVRVDREGPLAVISIDNPPMNLFSEQVLDGLVASAAELTRTPPRALLIQGCGELTSAGVDVQLFAGADAQQFAAAARRYLDQIVRPLEELPCPTIAACHGMCLTAAFELALACDLIVASSEAQFGLVEAALGLSPAMGGTQRLAARVGVARASELVITGRLYDATVLQSWGLIARTYPKATFAESARRFASRIAEGPTVAHAATKQILAAYRHAGVSGADDRTPELTGALLGTEDLKEGIASFLSHGPGKASFKGR